MKASISGNILADVFLKRINHYALKASAGGTFNGSFLVAKRQNQTRINIVLPIRSSVLLSKDLDNVLFMQTRQLLTRIVPTIMVKRCSNKIGAHHDQKITTNMFFVTLSPASLIN